MNFKESKPIYLQIADKICDDILARLYLPDERIPSVRDNAAATVVNVNTMMRAYEHLQQRSIIYNRRGMGYYVVPGAADIILASRREVFFSEELPFLFSRLSQLGVTPEEMARLYADYLKG